MREVIWKFPLAAARTIGAALAANPENAFDIAMPLGAEIIRVDKDNKSGEGALWAIVHPNAHKETRRFMVVTTGGDFPEAPHKYIGMWQDGVYTWHVLEIL